MILLLALVLAGCGQKRSDEVAQAPGTAKMEAAPLADVAPQSAAAPASAAPAAPSVALPQIAYTYDYTLELPAKAVVPLFERHRAACEAAGPARCQIIGAETETVARTDTRATLTLRAETRWLAAFRAGLAGSAEAADGRLAATASEDLGRQLSDSGARLRALTTLRDRLQQLLATRTGKLGELLEIERELARVEGEIDATRSALADMSGRVSLPKATIVYRPDSLTVASADGGQAGLAGSLYNVGSTSLFVLLNFLAAVLPWLVILVPLVWVVRTLLRRRHRA